MPQYPALLSFSSYYFLLAQVTTKTFVPREWCWKQSAAGLVRFEKSTKGLCYPKQRKTNAELSSLGRAPPLQRQSSS
jgi:hypothetical protein